MEERLVGRTAGCGVVIRLAELAAEVASMRGLGVGAVEGLREGGQEWKEPLEM